VDVQESIACLRACIADPSQGLPEEVFLFISSVTPMVNVDLLIKDERRRTLLTWREDGFYPPSWHVPGGIVRFKEGLHDRIAAVAKSELGADVAFQPAPLAVNEIVVPQRAVRGHFISFLYECRLLGPPDDGLRYEEGTPRPGEWAWHERCPDDLISVHAIYRKYF
jgi:ADP-ribose pyrophosphatase YjhB (NUDIX family)